MLTEANANRTDGLISVFLAGYLPTPHDEVIELGHIPGAGMSPARIFLEVRRKPENNRYSGKIWKIRTVFLDYYSRIVEVYINNQLVRRVRVIEFATSNFCHH